MLYLQPAFALSRPPVIRSRSDDGLDTSSWITSTRTITMSYSDANSFTSPLWATVGLFGVADLHLQEGKLRTEIHLLQLASATRVHKRRTLPAKNAWLIILLLLSGNIYPNPGPNLTNLENPVNLKNSCVLRFIHANVRSLINKIDAICLWVKLTECNIIVLSETWLKPSITNVMIHIDMPGYNVFRAD